MQSESKKRFFKMRTGHIRLDILMAWSQFGPDQHYVFDYIDALNHNHSSKVNAKRDSKGRPWVCIEELCSAIPCIRQGPHTVALWMRSMAKAGLLERAVRKVIVPGVGVRTMVWARPSQRYEDLKYIIDERGMTAYVEEILPEYRKRLARSRNIGGHRRTASGRTPVSLNTPNTPYSLAGEEKTASSPAPAVATGNAGPHVGPVSKPGIGTLENVAPAREREGAKV